MKILRIISIIINSISILISFIVCLLIGILAAVFLYSHVNSDKMAGFILIIFIPVILAFSGGSLLLVILKKKGILFWIGFIAGFLLIIFYSFAVYLLPSMIEAGARP